MKEVNVLVQDLNLRLKRLGITPTAGYGRVIWSDLEKPLVLKVCMFQNFVAALILVVVAAAALLLLFVCLFFPPPPPPVCDRLCGLVVRVSGYKSGGPGCNSQHYGFSLEIPILQP
jgi:hypothetical protein